MCTYMGYVLVRVCMCVGVSLRPAAFRGSSVVCMHCRLPWLFLYLSADVNVMCRQSRHQPAHVRILNSSGIRLPWHGNPTCSVRAAIHRSRVGLNSPCLQMLSSIHIISCMPALPQTPCTLQNKFMLICSADTICPSPHNTACQLMNNLNGICWVLFGARCWKTV